MRVELINQTNLRAKAKELTGKKNSYDDFIQKIKSADWNNVNDMKNTFATADPIGDDRVIFDLPGANRLICRYKFITDIKQGWVALYICKVCTHEEYDKLNQNTKSNKEPNLKTVWDY